MTRLLEGSAYFPCRVGPDFVCCPPGIPVNPLRRALQMTVLCLKHKNKVSTRNQIDLQTLTHTQAHYTRHIFEWFCVWMWRRI